MMIDEKKIQELSEQMDLIRRAIEAAYEASDKQTARVDYLYAELAQHADYQRLAKEHTAMMVQQFKEKRNVNV